MNQSFDFNNDITLENVRVRLSPWDSKLATTVLAEVSAEDPTLLKYSLARIHSAELLRDYSENNARVRKEGIRFPFLIYDKQNGAYAGSTSYGNVSNEHLRLEIGWTWIGKGFQRTGLNRACKHALLKYAFEELKFERVELKTDARNSQSRKAIEGIGGVFEGMLRSHIIMADGVRRDTVYYSILRQEWPEIKDTIFSQFED